MKTFLKVPQKVEHGLLLVTELVARYGSKEPMSLDEVAEKGSISQGYLEEVARLLRAAGIITGRRGAKGGYVLARDPRDVTIADVITAIEGRCWSEECIGESGAIPEKTPRHDVWRKVQGQVMATLHGTSIAAISGHAARDLETVAPPRTRRVRKAR